MSTKTKFITPNGSLMSVCCVYVQIWPLFYIRDKRYRIEINFCVCLINDYSLIADLHIFVYERAECGSISLELTKVKLSLLNNFMYDIK